jgi:predicted MFS family arabinose efflux permease
MSSSLSASPSVGRSIFAALCASLVGIGLARFAYTPLIPPLIEAHWFAANDVMYLGAANLVGYLVGAVGGRPLAARLGARPALQWMMALAALAFFACAVPLSVAWFFAWRFLSGLSGGIIMVLAAITVLPHIPMSKRGMASGAIFLGLGVGIAASGTLVPLLLQLGLWQTWAGLGVVSTLLTAASWTGWPSAVPASAGAPTSAAASAESSTAARPAAAAAATASAARGMKVLYIQYALMAVGLVPMMIFLVDYVARGLGLGAQTGALFWIAYGMGAIVGPMLYGAMGDRITPRVTSRVAIAAQIAAIALLVSTKSIRALILATLVIGTFPPGIVPIYLGQIQRLLPGSAERQSAAWSKATTIYALTQAIVGYAASWLLTASGGQHRLLFMLAAAGLLLALATELVATFAHTTPRKART